MNTIFGISSLISALLTTAYIVDHPVDMEAVKRTLSRFWQYCLNEDGEYLFGYGMMSLGLVVLVVILLNWSWYI